DVDRPYGMAMELDGGVLIADRNHSRILKRNTNGVITTIAGINQGFGGDGGFAINAALNEPEGVAVAPDGDVYIADTYNNRIRKITAVTGIISTVAGNGWQGYNGDNGLAVNAAFHRPSGIAVAANGDVFISDTQNHVIRRITAVTGIITTIAGTGRPGFKGDGVSAVRARLHNPIGIAVDADGNIVFADMENHRIRRIDADGIITTIAGPHRVRWPIAIAVDANGNIIFADSGHHRIRRISTDGTVKTIAGTGYQGFFGDAGPAIDAWLSAPRGVAVDVNGDIFVADTLNNRIRKFYTPSPPAVSAPVHDSHTGCVIF
nr:SMP-30/gluconolactonase/LRE family protein [Longispora sp. (in: high G+C Gram-positive bacteria)]